jgi:hypothetical protein
LNKKQLIKDPQNTSMFPSLGKILLKIPEEIQVFCSHADHAHPTFRTLEANPFQ